MITAAPRHPSTRCSAAWSAKAAPRSARDDPAAQLSFPKIRSGLDSGRIIASSEPMLAILHSLGMFVADLFKSRCLLEAENLFLRHQLSIALRRGPLRLRLRGGGGGLLGLVSPLRPGPPAVAPGGPPETIP